VPAENWQTPRHPLAISSAFSAALLPLGLLAISAQPACAQVSASISVNSEDRFRGQSVSNGHPVVVANLSYDDASGVYVGAAGSVALTPSSLELVNVQANLGYVWQLKSGPTLDFGVVRSDYTEYSGGGYAAHYTEVYAGLLTRHLALHMHLSPDYLVPDRVTLYGDIDAATEIAPNLQLNGHAGLLTRLSGPSFHDSHDVQYDWRVGLARQAGPVDMHLSLTGGGPGHDYYEGHSHDRTALVFGLTCAF
jgi:uncharacterized protein (TIGR02001 family)